MNEERRLKIAKRQLMLAQIARREARLSLANAISDEERSAQIHARSCDLLHEYAKRVSEVGPAAQSDTLQISLAFVRSLQDMTDNAQGALKDASDQAEWQVRALAAAETRMSAHETRLGQEKRALNDLRERREVPPELTGASGMARKLQNQRNAGEAVPRRGNR
ncbi:hypothetical protein [uncultured Erythrobacter sp.]|uniref:hypothetical protein n=1 Tax=uncultured Erythrobacter sp. TaxID=263913 RepID=UPI0026054868|nr:hypothetical protein [uncultured Erythrobacter sp.]